jgi:hypothetical protein
MVKHKKLAFRKPKMRPEPEYTHNGKPTGKCALEFGTDDEDNAWYEGIKDVIPQPIKDLANSNK